MSVMLEQELVNGSFIADNKLVLEPIIDHSQTLPFLESQILKPELFRASILQLNQILMAHPGVNLNRIYDPVVTVTENHIDFEGFARFGHSFCKIRFPDTIFKERIRQEGIINVDFNPRFIMDLRSRFLTKNLWLYIDPDGIEVAIDNKAHTLEKIVIPKWWNDAYREIGKFVDVETMEVFLCDEYSDQYKRGILSGRAFQNLVKEVEYSCKGCIYLHKGSLDCMLDVTNNCIRRAEDYYKEVEYES